MWSQHGFWNGLENRMPEPSPSFLHTPTPLAPHPYYAAYPPQEPEMHAYYKQQYGNSAFEQQATFPRSLHSDQINTPQRTNNNAKHGFSTPVHENAKQDLADLTPPDSDSGDREDKPFQCGYPKCNYETNRRNNLKRHMMTMHERLNSPHFCCGVTFFRKADMRAHTKEVHTDGYPCTWPGCGKGFVRKALLDRHIKIHTGEKPFVCPICQYGTSHKSNLDRHVRIHFKPSNSPSKYYQMYDMAHQRPMPGMVPQNPFLPGWTKPELEKEIPTLPDSTTDHPQHQRMTSPARRQSFLFSPDKLGFSVPFSPVNLDSITPLNLSPVKAMHSRQREDLDMWWNQTTAQLTPENTPRDSSPEKLSSSIDLYQNTSLDLSSPYSATKNTPSFLSAPETPPTPGKRTGHSISHGIRSILGDVVPPQEDEEIDVDGEISEEEEDDSYVPKKLRLAKKHINTEA